MKKEVALKGSFLHLLGFLFIILIIIQLIPLPPGILHNVSPKTYQLYAETIPGYDGHNLEIKDIEDRFFLSSALNSRDAHRGTSDWKPISLNRYRTREMLFKFISFFLVFAITAEHFRTRAKRDMLIRAFLAIALFQAFYGLLEYLSGHQHIFFLKKIYNLESVTGTFVNPNHFAGFLEMILPIGLGWFFYRSRRSEQELVTLKEKIASLSQPRKLKNFLIFFAISIIFSGLLLSYSRSGIIACASSLILFFALTFLWYRKRKMKFAIVIFLLVILITPIIGFGLQKMIERFSSMNIEFSEQGERKGVWKDSMSIFYAFPLFGTGFGTFDDIFTLHSSKNRTVRYDYAHNDYIQILTETGIGGLLIAIAAIVFIIVRCFRKAVRQRDERQAVFFGLLASFFAILIHEFTDFNLYIYSNALLFSIVIALLILETKAVPPEGRSLHETSGQNPGFTHPFVPVFFLIALLSLGFYSLRHLPASIIQLELKALSAQTEPAMAGMPEEALALAQKACEKERDNPDYYRKLADLRFDSFSMDKEALPQIHDIYGMLYNSLRLTPTNHRIFISLSRLSTLKLNTGEGIIDVPMIREFETLSRHYIETAMKLDPSNSLLSSEAGKYYLRAGEMEKAVEHFRRVLRLNSDLAVEIFTEVSHETESEQIAEMIVENDPLLQRLYGDFLFRSRNYLGAEKYYKRSFELDPDKAEAYRRLCQIYWNAGNNEEVRLLSERMLKGKQAKKPDVLSEVHYNLSLYHEKEDSLSSALESARIAVRNNDDEIKNHLLLARLHLKKGDADEAVSALKRVLNSFDSEQLRCSAGAVHFLLGEAYEAKNDIVKAYEEYNRALKSDPGNREIQKRINFLEKGLR